MVYTQKVAGCSPSWPAKSPNGFDSGICQVVVVKEGAAQSKGDRPVESGDHYETLRAVKQAAKLFEAYEVTRFTGYRQTQHGVQEVDVEILDAGPDVDPGLRYHVLASAEGKEATGNPGRTPVEALGIVHWFDLDS